MLGKKRILSLCPVIIRNGSHQPPLLKGLVSSHVACGLILGPWSSGRLKCKPSWTRPCSLGKPMLTKSVLLTALRGRTSMCSSFYPRLPIGGLNATKILILPQSWNMTCELSLEGTKQEIKSSKNTKFISRYFHVDILLSSLLNTSWNSRAFWSSIQSSFHIVSLSELFHEASTLVPQASFPNPDYTMFICTSAHLLMLCLLSGIAALMPSSYIQVVPFINFQIKSYLLEVIYE